MKDNLRDDIIVYSNQDVVDIKNHIRDYDNGKDFKPIRINKRGRVEKEEGPNPIKEIARLIGIGIVILSLFGFFAKFG